MSVVGAIGSAAKIEERILRMKWDADDFNKAAQNTLKLLDEVKNKVKEVTSEINTKDQGTSVNLDQINAAAQKVTDNFTVMGRTANKVLDQIADAAINTGKSIANALVIKPVASGFDEYGLLMDSTQVILSNTGRDLEDVKGALDDLNHYADKTIYNFGQMTNAIGRFSAAGVGLEDSVDAIQGLSNYSALVGANAQQNISAMDAVSKALAGGSLKLRQWMQFEAAGSLGGKLLRDQLIETGKELGVFDQAWSDATGKTIQGADLLEEAQTSLRETLKYGWVTSDVLLQTLAKFSDEETELGQKAIKAATEVRTFAKMWDALQEAVQSSWSQSFQYIFGDYEEGTELWTSINDEVSAIMEKINGSRNDMLQVWHDNAGRAAVIGGIRTFYAKIKREVTQQVHDLLGSLKALTGWDWIFRSGEEMGSALVEASHDFFAWAEELKFDRETLFSIGQALHLIVNRPLKEIQKFIDSGGLSAIFQTTANKIQIVLNLLGSLKDAVDEVFGAASDIGIGELFAKYQTVIAGVTEEIKKMTGELSMTSEESEEIVENGGTIRTWQDIFARLLIPVKKFIELLQSINTDDLIAIGVNAYAIFESCFDSLSRAVEYTTSSLNSQWLGDAVSKLREFSDAERAFFEDPVIKDDLMRIFSGIISAAQIIGEILEQIARAIFPEITENGESVAKGTLDVLASVGDWLLTTKQIIDKYDVIYNSIQVIKAFLAPFVEFLYSMFSSILSLIESITGIKFEVLGPAVLEDTGEARNAFEAFAMDLQSRLHEISLKAYDLANTILLPFTVAKRLLFGLFAIANKNDWLSKLATPFKDLFDAFKNADYSPVLSILINIANIVGRIGNGFADAVQNIFKVESGTNAISGHLSIIGQIADIIDKITKSDFFNTVLVRGAGSIASLFRLIYDAFAQVREFLSESGIIKDITDLMDPIAKLLGGAITYLGDLFRWLERVIRHNSLIKKGLEAIYSIVRPLLKYATRLLNSLTTTIEKTFNTDLNLGNWMSRVLGSPRKHMEEFSTEMEKTFDWIKEKGNDFGRFLGVEVDDGTPYIEESKTLMEMFGETTGKVWDKIKGDTKDGTEESKGWLKSWIDSTTESWNKMKEESEKGTKEHQSVWDKFTSIFKVEKGSKEAETGFGKFLLTVQGFFDKAKALWDSATAWFSEKWKNLSKESGMDAAFETMDFESVVTSIGNAFKIVGGKIGNMIKSLFSPKDVGKEVSEAISTDAKVKEEAITTIGDWFNGLVEDIKTWVKDTATNFWPDLIHGILGGNKLENGEISKGLIGAILAPFADSYVAIAIRDWVNNAKASIGKTLAPLKEVVGPFVESAKTILIGIFKTAPIFLGNDKGEVTLEAISNRVNDIIMQFGSVQILKAIGGAGELMENTAKVLQKVAKKIPKLANSVKSILDNTAEGVKNIATSITGMFNKVGESFTTVANGFNNFLNTTIKGFLDKTTEAMDQFLNKTVPKMFKRISKGINGVLKGFKKMETDIGKGVKRYLTGKGLKEAATGILLFSVAVGILAASIYALAQLDKEDLTKGAIAVGAIIAVLGLVAFVLIKALTKNGKDRNGGTEAAGAALQGFAGGVEILKDGIGDVIGEFKKALDKIAKVGMIFAFIAAIKTIIDGIVKIGKLNPEQAMVGIIGVVVALIAVTAALKSLMKSAGKGSFQFRQVLAMLVMCKVISEAVDQVIRVGGMSWEDMAKGVIGMSVLMIALGVMMSSIFKSTQRYSYTNMRGSNMIVRQVLAMLAICVAIKTVGDAVLKVGELPVGKIFSAGLVIAALMVVFTIATMGIMQSGSENKVGAGLFFNLIAMCAVIWSLGSAVKKIGKLDPWDSFRAGAIIAGLLGLFGWIIKGSGEIKGKAVAAIAIIGVVIAALVFVLGKMAKEFNVSEADKFEQITNGLSKVILSLTAVLVVVGLIGKFVNGDQVDSGLAAFAKVTAVITIIVGIITALTEAANYFGEKTGKGALGDKFWESVKKVLTAVGEAIGGFVGGIVGQFQETKAKHMEAVGTSLSKFAENSKPFLDMVGDEKKMKGLTKGVDKLAGAMLKLVAGDLIKKLNIFSGKTSPFDNFSAMLEKIGPAFGSLTTALDGADVKKVGYAIRSMSKLVEATGKIPNQGGKIADIFGDNTLTQFAEGLEAFTPKFGKFILTMSAYTDLSHPKKVERAISFASQVAEMASKIPNQGGKIADFFGDNTLSQFAEGIEKFTPKFGNFIIAMEASMGAVNPDTINRAIDFAIRVTDFASHIPNQGGIVNEIFGDNTLIDFAEGLSAFTKPFTNFLFECERNLGATNPDTISKALDFADRIATFANNLPDVKEVKINKEFLGGFVQVSYTDNPLLGFAHGLEAFTPEFAKFLTTISSNETVMDETKITQALNYMHSIANFVNKLPEVHEVSIGNVTIFSDDKFGNFVKDLGDFGTEISKFVGKLSEAKINPFKIGLALMYTDMVVGIAEKAPKFAGLEQFIGGATNLKEFGAQLSAFAPNFKTYLETVGAAKYDASVIDKSNIAMEALAGFADTVEGKEGVLSKFFFGDSSLTGIGEGLGTFATGMTEYSTALESVNWDNIDKSTEFVTKLGELATSMTNVGSLLYISMGEITSQIDETLKSLSTKISGGYEKATTAKDFEEDMKSSAGHVGELISTGIEDGFNKTINGSTANIDNSIQGWINTEQSAVDTKLKSAVATGASSLIDELKRTLNTITLNVGPKATENFASIAGYGVEGIRSKWTEFFNAGVYVVDGFIVGIQNKKQDAIDELQDLANAATQAVTVPLQINSPSKVFERIGGFLPAGLALGVKKKAPDAIKAVKENLARPISLIENVLNGDIEYSPRIRPVVDLDGARSSVSTLNGMFGSRSIGLADATIRTTNDNHLARINAKAAGYNDRNVVRAIQGLQADVGTLRSSLNGMGLYLDSDTLVGGIVNKVDKKLGVNQLRRRRYA